MPFDPETKLTRESFSSLPPLCTDGAWGTELLKLGGEPDEVKDLWNLSAPDRVLQVARAYVEAGANIILTNTFSANRVILEPHGAADRAAEATRARSPERGGELLLEALAPLARRSLQVPRSPTPPNPDPRSPDS